MLNLQTLPRTPVTVRYASQVNKRFHKSQSQYVDIATRLAEAIKHAEWRESSVAQAAKEFAVRNKNMHYNHQNLDDFKKRPCSCSTFP